MSYLRSDNNNGGLPSIGSARGLLGDSSLRRSLTRLDDLDLATPRHVRWREGSPTNFTSSSVRGLRSASPVRSRSPTRDSSPTRTISEVRYN